MTTKPRRVWILSELYYPEETSTGYLLTKIAEGLARRHDVRVICAHPTYASRGVRAPKMETHGGVKIRRVWSTAFDKNSLPLRFVNLVTISASIFLAMLLRVRRGDVVIVVTNPPFLPYLVRAATAVRGATCMLLVHDVYPEVFAIAGLMTPRSLFYRFIDAIGRRLYRSMHRVIVLGRDMQTLVERKLAPGDPRIVIIENWADVGEIGPRPRAENKLLREIGVQDELVVQYAGNMGRTHGLEDVVEAARRLRGDNVRFVFLGSGAKRPWIEETVRAEKLANVTMVGNRPRAEQEDFLNACDVAIISFMPGMAGISVPSRMYNILAAGKPILAVADPESELARVVTEERVGWVVAPGRPEAIVEAIRNAAANAEERRAMGERAVRAANERYSFDAILGKYERLIDDVTL